MLSKTLIRVALTLLLLAGQLVGVRGASGGSQSIQESAYFCCCIGECHCTADCCNHAPDRSLDEDRPSFRKAGDWPVFQSPKGCGPWQGTLRQGPGQTELYPPEVLRLVDPTTQGRRRPVRHDLFNPRSRVRLTQSSPRAPPGLPPSPASA